MCEGMFWGDGMVLYLDSGVVTTGCVCNLTQVSNQKAGFY